MNVPAQPDSIRQAEIAPERLLNRSARSDFYFRPDPWIASMSDRVERLLEKLVESDIPVMDVIGRHMLFGYAKRLRPVFVLLSQRLFSDELMDKTVECGAVCELIHCATLFHDDVIDGARLRKGRQAANTIWGNKSAVIMGDDFFVLAFTLLAQMGDVRLVRIFVDTCKALAEGVMLEIKHTQNINVTEEIHIDIITRKTAKFFKTAMIVGGYLGDADRRIETHLAGFGLNFGLAFQMSDDLLDLFADPDATGKPRGTDITAGIYTIPIIHALNNDREFEKKFTDDVRSERLDKDLIDEISLMLRYNGSFEYALGLVHEYGEKALTHLDSLPDGLASDAFRMLIHKIMDRKFD